MGTYRDVTWSAGDETGLPARDRRSGPYRTYVPDPLGRRPLVVDPDVSKRVAQVERSIRRLAGGSSGFTRYFDDPAVHAVLVEFMRKEAHRRIRGGEAA